MVDMDLLKKLREITYAPLKDCKEALISAEGDLSRAQDILREKGMTKAAKKADRETNDGIVKVKQSGDLTIGIKLGCETDFVARNELFTDLAGQVLDLIESYGKEVASLSDIDENFLNEKVNPLIQESIGRIGENIKLLDAFITRGKSYVYVHPGDKVVAVVYYNGDAEEVAKEVALQIAAMNPDYLSKETIPANILDEMKEKFMEEVDKSKPAEMIEKIVEGKINKALSEFVLLEQAYIRDETKKIKSILPDGFEVKSYTRFSI